MPSAAGIIIGDEILSGKFRDQNGPYLIHRLRTLGVDLRHLATINDDVERIGDEVRACSERYDHVFTSGGVGPTHDDRTFSGVARAFGVELSPHPELVALLHAAGLTNDAAMRMAIVPEGVDLVFETASRYPTLRMHNVWILPGVPRLFQMKFELISHHVRGQAVRTVKLFTRSRETEIAAHLTAVQDEIPDVDIGSYPRFGEGDWRVIVTVDGRDDAAVDRAVQRLHEGVSFLDVEG